ncbi:hypothetical protein WG66_001286 [Moniliophthora roreri]|nr:hypothetical protein WG66_001286 [Moniliophthora roreri]
MTLSSQRMTVTKGCRRNGPPAIGSRPRSCLILLPESLNLELRSLLKSLIPGQIMTEVTLKIYLAGRMFIERMQISSKLERIPMRTRKFHSPGGEDRT